MFSRALFVAWLLMLAAHHLQVVSAQETSTSGITTLDLPVGPLVWDAKRDVFYGILSAEWESIPQHSLVAIDPEMPAVIRHRAIGEQVNDLVLTSGREALYVALEESASIMRLNPADFTVHSTFAVGIVPEAQELSAKHLCIVPGRPDLLIVSRGFGPVPHSVAIYRNGTLLPAVVPTYEFIAIPEAFPTSNPSLYALASEVTQSFTQLRLHARGLSKGRTVPFPAPNFYPPFRASGDRLYSASGYAFNMAQMRPAGLFPPAHCVWPDAATKRLYALEPSGSAGEAARLVSYDLTSLTLLDRTPLTKPFFSPPSVWRWGKNGLAVGEFGSVSFLQNPHAIPSAPETDLSMTISASPRVAAAGEPLTYTVRVTNLGRSPAPDGLISITLEGPQNLVSATSATGPIAVQDSKLTLATGTIAAQRSVTLTVLTTPNKSGSVVGLSIEVASAARERRRDNNETVKWVGVSRAPGAEDGIHALEFAASDMAWDSIRGRIYASVPEPDPDRFESQVLALNPESLEVSRTIDLAGKPGRLALTQRSEALYVAINGGNAAISRLTPSTMSLHSRFPLAARGRDNSTVILDLCPVPGAPELLFVIRGSDSNASPRDGAIDLYRRGRSIRSLKPEGSFFSSIDATDAPDVFVAADTSRQTLERFRLRRGVLQAEGSSPLTQEGQLSFLDRSLLGTAQDQAAGRIYFLAADSSSFYWIMAVDRSSHEILTQISVPGTGYDPVGFLRWGAHGLAYSAGAQTYLFRDGGFVPSEPATDLSVMIALAPAPASVGQPCTASLQVSNQVANAARAVRAQAYLTTEGTVESVAGPNGIVGTVEPIGGATFEITCALGDLGVGASAAMTIVFTPSDTIPIQLSAQVASKAIEPNYKNNATEGGTEVAYVSTPDTVHTIYQPGHNLVLDPGRGLLWIGRATGLISVDLRTGLTVDQLPDVKATPLAISANGRYLYTRESTRIQRIDLETKSVDLTIANPQASDGFTDSLDDIEILEGDGTQFLASFHVSGVMVAHGDQYLAKRIALDGIVMEPTASPNEFIGLRRQGVFKINIDSEGCTATAPVAGLFTNPGPIEGRGNYLLSSSGKLVDSQTLSPIADLGASGFPAPCVDLTTSRAYLVSSTSIKAFALSDGSLAGEFVFPEPLSSSPSQAMRWGSDGFALSFSDQVKIVRWTERPTGGN